MNLPSPPLRLRRTRPGPELDGGRPQLRPRPSSATPRESRLSGGLHRLSQPLPLIGVALILFALLGYLLVASEATGRTEILVAARALPAGTQLTRTDLAGTRIAGNQTLLARLLPADTEATLIGRRLTTSVPAGVPIARAAVATAGAGSAAFTLTVPYLHALGGSLQPGDRVSVLATFTSATGTSTARLIARDLEVLTVGEPPTGIDQTASTVPVTVALPDPSLASALALANSVGKIDLLRDGRPSSTRIAPASVTGAGA
jgi:Flp pilus assembly protein CpaB